MAIRNIDYDLDGCEDAAAQDGYEALQPLDHSTVTLARHADDPGEAKWGFSAIIAREALATRKLYGFLRTGNVTEPAARQVLHGLLELFRPEWLAPSCNRQQRYDLEEKLAEKWLKRMPQGDDDPERGAAAGDGQDQDGEPTVDELLQTWHTAAAYQLQVRITRLRRGLAAVESHRARWHDATERKADAEYKAASLPPEAYQYFGCRTRQFEIMAERSLDQALGIPERDYSEVKRRIADGADINDVVSELPWAYQIAYEMVQESMAEGDKHREFIMSLHTQTLPYNRQPPKARRRFGFGPRRDQGEGRGGDIDRDREDE